MREAMAEEKRAEQARKAERAAASAAQAWVERFRPLVERQWRLPPSAKRGTSCTIRVQLIPGGGVTSVQASCSGGDSAFERSAEQAVRKAAPFPMPTDPLVAKQLLGQTVKFNFHPN